MAKNKKVENYNFDEGLTLAEFVKSGDTLDNKAKNHPDYQRIMAQLASEGLNAEKATYGAPTKEKEEDLLLKDEEEEEEEEI